MSRSQQKRPRKTDARNARAGETPAPGQIPPHGASAMTRGEERSRVSWYESQRPVVRFVGLFVISLGLLFLCQIIPFYRDEIFPSLLRLNAEVVGTLLSAFTQGISVNGSSIVSPRFSMEIRKGCDAVEPLTLFISAVLASPIAIWGKIPGILVGTLFVLAMNLVRLVTLFYIGIYFPSLFERAHLEVWPVVFILFAVFLWLSWVRWAQRNQEPRHA